MIPELTNVTAGTAAIRLEAETLPFVVSRQTLKVAAVNTVIGAAALWAASNHAHPLESVPMEHVVVNVLLFALIAATLPVQFLLVTRPLVKDVAENSAAPRGYRALAVVAACTGSLLTALAYWQAWSTMSGA